MQTAGDGLGGLGPPCHPCLHWVWTLFPRLPGEEAPGTVAKLSCQTWDPQLGRDLESVVNPVFWGLLLNFVPEDLGILGGRSQTWKRGSSCPLSAAVRGHSGF